VADDNDETDDMGCRTFIYCQQVYSCVDCVHWAKDSNNHKNHISTKHGHPCVHVPTLSPHLVCRMSYADQVLIFRFTELCHRLTLMVSVNPAFS